MGGYTPHPTYEETCTGLTGRRRDRAGSSTTPKKTSPELLLKAFWENHDPTTSNRQGNDVGTAYRSAIYWTTEGQRIAAPRPPASRHSRRCSNDNGLGTITTEIRSAERAGPFYLAEDYHQGYLHKNPGGYCNHGFCQVAYNPAAHGQDAPTKVTLPEA